MQRLPAAILRTALVLGMLPSSAAMAATLLEPDSSVEERYGYAFDGAVEARESADFEFRGMNGADQRLSFSVYDIDNDSEVQVRLNDRIIGYLPQTADDGYANARIQLPGDRNRRGTNTLSFVQSRPGNRWGIQNIRLEVTGSPSVTLEPDITDYERYGFSFVDQSGQRESAKFSFTRADENLHLFYTAYDIDNAGEVSVFLNGDQIARLEPTGDDETGDGVLAVPLDDQINGRNTLEFRQARPGNRWGVTDLLLSLESSCAYPQ